MYLYPFITEANFAEKKTNSAIIRISDKDMSPRFNTFVMHQSIFTHHREPSVRFTSQNSELCSPTRCYCRIKTPALPYTTGIFLFLFALFTV